MPVGSMGVFVRVGFWLMLLGALFLGVNWIQKNIVGEVSRKATRG